MSQKSVNRAARHGTRRKSGKTTTGKTAIDGKTTGTAAATGDVTAGRKKVRRRIDWRSIEAGWRAGVAVRELARQYRVSPSTIYRRGSKLGWRRSAPAAANAPEAPVPRLAGRGAEAARTPAPHDLRRLRMLAAKLRERLERVIDGEVPADAVLGARESPAALLLKLCQITEKIIAIERRVAGADAPTHAKLNEQDRDILNRFKRRYGVG